MECYRRLNATMKNVYTRLIRYAAMISEHPERIRTLAPLFLLLIIFISQVGGRLSNDMRFDYINVIIA